MTFRRLPAAAQRAARLLPAPAGTSEMAIRQAAWVARCVGRGQSAPLQPGDVTALGVDARGPDCSARLGTILGG